MNLRDGGDPAAGSGSVVVVGHAARDLVLRVDALPSAGGSAPVTRRIERLGGKGANIAVGLRQLNAEARVSLVAVFGADTVGGDILAEATSAGLDVAHAVRRGRTALLVDLVESGGRRRLLEDVPPESLLTPEDVSAAADLIEQADTVVLQLQQPAEAVLTAARAARSADARVVMDGAPEESARGELLALADVLRADAAEASQLAGAEVGTLAQARSAAAELRAAGPLIVALSVPGAGDLVTWPDGERLFPHEADDPVDPTGGGDAFVAGLVTGLRRGATPDEAGSLAAHAAALTVRRLGGHPELDAANGSAADDARSADAE